MSKPLTIQLNLHVERGSRGQKELADGPAPDRPLLPLGRVPRVARLLALAHKFEDMLKAGDVADYAELARLGHVTRARISQVMNLLLLAPDIQEAILFLPLVKRGRDPLRLDMFQPIALTPDWDEQRERWKRLTSTF